MKNFRNKKVYIVGGSNGIGLASAKVLFEHGANILIFSRDKHKLTSATKEISEQHVSTEQGVAWMQIRLSLKSKIKLSRRRPGLFRKVPV